MRGTATEPRWPRAVLFDLDGTLADSFDAIARALNRALREQGLAEHSLHWVHRHVGRGAAALIRDAVGPEAGPDLALAVGRDYSAAYERSFLAQTPPLPGARAVLARVHEVSDGRVAVVSNKAARLCRRWLDHWELAGLVAHVSGPDASGARKPDPRALGPALGALRVQPGESLLVGDMEVDAAAGRNAGIPVVAVRSAATSSARMRAAGALAVLFDLRDLPDWLAGNGRGWR
ncbi:MAG: HAD hydrolase-like protein [Acidobacteria bacterium]|nr:HAD hydrolase-like protein [Acidobacteriota bacterium]